MKDRIKLSPEQLKEIRQSLFDANIETRAMADRFGVTHNTMYYYLIGRNSIPVWIYERLQKIIASHKKYK